MKDRMRLCRLFAAGAVFLLSVSGPAASVPASEGGVLNICCMDSNFRDLLKVYDPAYQEDEEGNAFMGDVAVRWTILSAADGAYQDRLDAMLPVNSLAAPDDRIDLLLLEEEDTEKYVQSGFLLDPVSDLGIPEEAFADQFPFSKNCVRDAEGRMRASALSCEPGLFRWRREAAAELFGTDDEDAAAAGIRDMESLEETAVKAAERHMQLFRSADELYPVFAYGAGYWVKDPDASVPEAAVPAEMKQWAEFSRSLNERELFGPDAVFFIGEPDMAPVETEEEGETYGLCPGPSDFLEGALFIACAEGSDNTELAARIIRTMTCDRDMLTAMTQGSGHFANTVSGMEEMAQGFSSTVYGGINSLRMMVDAAERLEKTELKRSAADRIFGELFRECMAPYIAGEISYGEAEEEFLRRADVREEISLAAAGTF